LTKEVGVEVPYVISVNAHATLCGRPRSNQGARQGRFAGAGLTDDRNNFARCQPEADLGNRR
jgi:hypothetical protein